MRNKTAFIFILLANIALLAHAVIPHQHHIEALESSIGICTHFSKHDHHHGTIPVCDNNHHDQKSTRCLIQTLVIPGNQQEEFKLFFKTVLNVDLFLLSLDDTIISPKEIVDNSYIIFTKEPLYSRLLNTSQGLRAPPVC